MAKIKEEFTVVEQYRRWDKTKTRQVFDVMMYLLLIYSVTTTLFYLAFGGVKHPKQELFDYYIEYLFKFELFVLLVAERNFKLPRWLASWPLPLQWYKPDWWVT